MDQYHDLLTQYFDMRLAETQDDTEAYQHALEEKADALRCGTSIDSIQLRELEERLALLEKRNQSISKAIDQGQLARATAFDIINDLERLWFFPAPGVRMNRTQIQFDQIRSLHIQDVRLQKEIEGLRNELKSEGICFDHSASVGELIRGERAMLDMVFCEDEILCRAQQAIENMQMFLDSLRPMLERLENMRINICTESEDFCKKRIALIEQSRIFHKGH